MDALTLLGVINYGLVLLYGLFLSVAVAGGCRDRGERRLVLLLCPVFFLIQTPCWLILGAEGAKRLYPLMVHLPLALAMMFGLKKTAGITLVSISTAYLCCQIPRCGNIAAALLTGSALAGEIAYTLLIGPVYVLLRRFFAPAAHNAMTDSRQSLLLFGSLPVFYYGFDYATTIYTNLLYEGGRPLVEMLPSILILFYVVFLTAYRQQLQQRSQTQLQSSMLSAQLKQAEGEIAALRRSESQSALYRHDMRHHLLAIDGFLSADRPQQAREYIQSVCTGIEAITPKRFCEHELANLLLSSFADRAERSGVRMTVEAALPGALGVPDAKLCALLSNGLENALHSAAAPAEEDRRWIRCFCGVRAGKLLITIENPYEGSVAMSDGLPLSGREGHGYGCRSIRTIVRSGGGLCAFQPEGGVFTLRIVLPVQGT